MKMTSLVLAGLLCLCTVTIQAQNKKNYPPVLKNAEVQVYKSVGDVKLNMYIYKPAGHKPSDQKPAIVFFFGGGWRAGTPKQFEKHCEYLASRGMVAMTADYRVSSRHGVKAVACVTDAKSAVRWIRQNAKKLGVDPKKVVASGGSAGGHTGACTGVITGFEESGEDLTISSKPNAMVLFNPALALAPLNGKLPLRNPARLKERMGVEPIELSPAHQVSAGVPPTLILHGKGDTTVPIITAQWFVTAMKKAGNRCELAGYEGQKHGFFNYGRDGNKNFVATVKRADEFLTSLGYLKGKPTVEEFLRKD